MERKKTQATTAKLKKVQTEIKKTIVYNLRILLIKK